MQTRMQKRQILQPTIYYAGAVEWRKSQQVDLEALKMKLSSFRKRNPQEPLMVGDFAIYEGELCRAFVIAEVMKDVEIQSCLVVYWPKMDHPGFDNQEQIVSLNLDGQNRLVGVFRRREGQAQEELTSFRLPPQVMAQYLGEELLLYDPKPLAVYPASCLNAIVAIEDARFLEHKGISPSGILRAFVKNVILRRKAQGGSTITQQLVKNFFLTSEKTYSRKIKEIMMALILENQFDKDLILENYLNIIYMGQKGSYQVRGYGAASEYYFGKPIADLNLAECSLLAAIVNNPGVYSPFNHPDKALERRSHVLEKMEEQKLISAEERQNSEKQTLPVNTSLEIYTTLPYFIQAVQKQLKEEAINTEEGLRIYTTIDLEAQAIGQKAIEKHLQNLEATKLKKSTKKLESILVAADVETGFVKALIGGRSYKKTQFNRVLYSTRQAGSTFKPFVYLTSLLGKTSDGEWYTPLTKLQDEPYTLRYGKQKWEPQNYNRKSIGAVPLFYALKESLNLPTARLANEIGLEKVAEVANQMGLVKKFDLVPSMSLGSFGISPLQLLQAYLNFARLGHKTEYTFIEAVLNLQGDWVWSFEPEQSDFSDLAAVEMVVGMLKETVRTGTAQSILAKGFLRPAAGKTGTTNDNRDTWFAGFTPHKLAIVWTGFDEPSPTGLTGASGAVPIWFDFMSEVSKSDAEDDFRWSEAVEAKKINLDEIQNLEMLTTFEEKDFTETELLFRRQE